jgi:hypothetical protein
MAWLFVRQGRSIRNRTTEVKSWKNWRNASVLVCGKSWRSMGKMLIKSQIPEVSKIQETKRLSSPIKIACVALRNVL